MAEHDKHPEKMSQRELRIEVQERRHGDYVMYALIARIDACLERVRENRGIGSLVEVE